MKKGLFGSSMLVGITLLTAAAAAQTAGPKAPFTAILDGSVNANFGILSGTQNSGTNGGHQRDVGMEQNAWMRFYFEGHADNGLTYGWHVRMIGSSSSITSDGFANDRESLYFRHPSFGSVAIGDDSLTAKGGLMPAVTADWGPSQAAFLQLGPDGKIEGEFLRNTDARAFAIFNTFNKVGADNAYPQGRAVHFWYSTPIWRGFNLQADYTPDGASRNEENFVTSMQASTPSATQNLKSDNFQNMVSVNLNWRGELSGVAVAPVVQYAHGQSKNLFVNSGGITGSNQAFNDINSYEAGIKLSYAGFKFGLEGTWYGKSGTPKAVSNGLGPIGKVNDMWGWATGLEYFSGPWIVGGYYWFGRAPGIFQLATAGTPISTTGTAGSLTSPATQAGNGVFEFNYYAAGVGYQVAPGLRLYSELFYYDMYNTHVLASAAQGANLNNGRNPHGQVWIFGSAFDF